MPPNHLCSICKSFEDSESRPKTKSKLFMQHRQWRRFGDADNWTLLTIYWQLTCAKELLGLYEDRIDYYAYLIWKSKAKALRKHMKTMSECIVWFLTSNIKDLDKFIQFKYANCIQTQSPEFYFSTIKTKYISHTELLFLACYIVFIFISFQIILYYHFSL